MTANARRSRAPGGAAPARASAPAGERPVVADRVFTRIDWVAFTVLSAVVALALGDLLLHWFEEGGLGEAPVVFVLLTLLIAATFAVFAPRWLSLPLMRRPRPMAVTASQRVGVVTTFVPQVESTEMLERTVAAMVAMEYPHETWVLDEGNHARIRAICARLGARHFTRLDKPQYREPSGPYAVGTKYGNYNAWLDAIGYEYCDVVVAFDPDHVPAVDFLERTLGYFEDPDVGYVQSAQAYYNQRASFVARGAAEETYVYYSSIQMSGFGIGYPVITGCHNAHRTAALRDLGGFAPHDGDDLLLTLLYRESPWKGVYVPEKLASGLTPVDWRSYLIQQRRWVSALLDIKLRIFPRIAARMSPIDWAVNLIHGLPHLYGVGMLVFVGLVVWMTASGDVPPVVTDSSVLRVGVLVAAFQACHLYRQRFMLDPENERGLHWRAAILRFGKWPQMLAGVWDARRPPTRAYTITPKTRVAGARRILWPAHLLVAVALLGALALAALTHNTYAPTLYAVAGALALASLAVAATDFLRFPEPYDDGLAAAGAPPSA